MAPPRAHLRAIFALSCFTACDSKTDAAASPAASSSAAKYAPAMSKDLVPPAAKGMVVGTSTRKELEAAFTVSETVVDKRLGGTAKVEYNGAPASHAVIGAADPILGGTAWFTKDAEGSEQLQRLELKIKGNETCAWNTSTLGKIEGTGRRPGSNRKFGGPSTYTAGTPDGSQPVTIECHASEKDAAETLSIAVDSPDGGSMVMSREG